MILKKMTNKTFNTEIEEILKKPYARQLIPDESGWYTALIQEFPGCIAEGATPQEALDNLNNAAYSWLESALSNDYPVKEPLDYSGFSGKIALRVPRSLHQEIAELSDLEETSMNQLIVSAISQYISREKLYKEMAAEFRKEVFAATQNITWETSSPEQSNTNPMETQTIQKTIGIWSNIAVPEQTH